MTATEFPHKFGEYTAIGPQCFTDADEAVINWKGENYYASDRLLFAPEGSELYSVFNTMLALETRWVPPVSGEGREQSHPYVAYPVGKFLAGLRTAMLYFAQFDKGRVEARRFIDVGCGVGTKVMLAAQMNWVADGLDFVPEYVAAAQELMHGVNGTVGASTKIYQGNALEWPSYAGYDLIYAYRPLVSDANMAELVEHICQHTLPGTMLFLPTYQPQNDKLAEYGHDLWQRVTVR